MSDGLRIIITADYPGSSQVKKAGDEIKRVGDEAEHSRKRVIDFNGILNTGLKVAAGIAVAGLAGLAGGLYGVVKAAADAQQSGTQLDAVLRSTGGAAGMNRDALIDLADSLSKLTPYEDDAIVGAESLMLTFTNISKATFPDAMRAALDLSTALGQDLQSSVIQIGKALQDPDGMSAMKRVGVSFTDAQIEMGKTLFETGKQAEYQKMVLGELSKEFGGSAQAAGTTFSGQLQIAQNALGNVAETIGGKLLPVLTPLIADFNKWLQDPKTQAAIENIGTWLATKIGQGLETVKSTLGDVQTIWKAVFGSPTPLGKPVEQSVGGIKGIEAQDLLGERKAIEASNAVPERLQAIVRTIQDLKTAFEDAKTSISTWVADTSANIKTWAKIVGDELGSRAAKFGVAGKVEDLADAFDSRLVPALANLNIHIGTGGADGAASRLKILHDILNEMLDYPFAQATSLIDTLTKAIDALAAALDYLNKYNNNNWFTGPGQLPGMGGLGLPGTGTPILPGAAGGNPQSNPGAIKPGATGGNIPQDTNGGRDAGASTTVHVYNYGISGASVMGALRQAGVV